MALILLHCKGYPTSSFPPVEEGKLLGKRWLFLLGNFAKLDSQVSAQ